MRTVQEVGREIMDVVMSEEEQSEDMVFALLRVLRSFGAEVVEECAKKVEGKRLFGPTNPYPPNDRVAAEWANRQSNVNQAVEDIARAIRSIEIK